MCVFKRSRYGIVPASLPKRDRAAPRYTRKDRTMATQMLYTPAQLQHATPKQRRQMIRDIGSQIDRDHKPLYERLGPFDRSTSESPHVAADRVRSVAD